MRVRDYENCPTREDHSGESLGDNDNSNDRGVPLRQYDSKRIRACSRFEGVSTPRHGENRPLRTKSVLKQEALRTRTSKRWEVYTSPAGSEREDRAICSHHAHSGERWPQEKKSGKPTTVFGADATSKAAKQIGRSRSTNGKPGDTRAIGEPKKQNEAGEINQSTTRLCSYYE